MSTDLMPAVIAAADLCGRSGAKQFEIGYLHDDVPMAEAGWYATALYNGAKVIGEGHGPEQAADALARKILHGGLCLDCGGKINVHPRQGHWSGRECVQKRHRDRWVKGCAR